MSKFAAALLLTAMCGCSYSTGPLRMSPDVYSVLTNAGGARSSDTAPRLAYEEANSECAKTKKKVVVISEQRGLLGRPAAFDLLFRCVPAEATQR